MAGRPRTAGRAGTQGPRRPRRRGLPRAGSAAGRAHRSVTADIPEAGRGPPCGRTPSATPGRGRDGQGAAWPRGRLRDPVPPHMVAERNPRAAPVRVQPGREPKKSAGNADMGLISGMDAMLLPLGVDRGRNWTEPASRTEPWLTWTDADASPRSDTRRVRRRNGAGRPRPGPGGGRPPLIGRHRTGRGQRGPVAAGRAAPAPAGLARSPAPSNVGGPPCRELRLQSQAGRRARPGRPGVLAVWRRAVCRPACRGRRVPRPASGRR